MMELDRVLELTTAMAIVTGVVLVALALAGVWMHVADQRDRKIRANDVSRVQIDQDAG